MSAHASASLASAYSHREDARAALQRAVETVPRTSIALVSAFGPGSIVLMHLLEEIDADVPVIFIDTLYHFPETLELVERARRRFSLDLRIFQAAPGREAFEAVHGAALWERDLERYHLLTKVEPYRTATAELAACITGRRRDQSITRATLDVWEAGQPVRINPLAAWTRADVWTYIRDHDLPYNPLHDRGYASIGDAPLTTRVSEGEHERAGRWRDTGRVECGIHVTHVRIAR